MQLTKQTDFAFRVLIYLASKKTGELSNIQMISERYEISKSHLMKVVQKLVSHGLVTSIRGQYGGILLEKELDEITLRQVIELMEATLTPVNCDEPVCKLKEVCRLKTYLIQAQNQYLTYLEQFTLADIVNDTIRQEIFPDMIRLN
ncbi:HTH-type transcriptional repressor NsrR [Hydrogenovibrio crunogenus]|uniref:HTH-type transcriptional repressor NsrR n=1 Tax=Hydrogenovibrio crunogenus TaxID=39765 RepID=A0A4V1C8R4_9GAMM|nr:Rrf2 family transcriptional regulator [Hydrogenovibrio crunogenus]QBZ82814.1 HTH-type transcriptional repressor NsrR [Hydrogenovibrio crunogenus]RUM90299.1 MAG: BadM/Rrf2 family transcriptional regulator [Thiomicrospira sp.]